jgi:hypothetical protein
MNRYSAERDLTMAQPARGPGATPMRRCWACNQNKAQAGGKLDKRTRLWRCAACVQKGTG